MEIKNAEFTLSAPQVSLCPKDTKPEFAFIGRSNVGKSSLINMLCGNKKLAKTSATPGKTMLINHFIINREWYLVDLPGYGFAKRSKTEIAALDRMIRGYILQREQLVNVFVLVDIRLEPQKIDLEFIDWLGMSIVILQQLTSFDKHDPATYYVDTVPVEINWLFVVALNVATMVIAIVVLIAPSYLISHINPARSMRYE